MALSLGRLAVIAACALPVPSCSKPAPPRSDGVFDVPLVTHHREAVRLQDQIRGKVVLIHFMFTTCNGICPRTTGNLLKVQELLQGHLGRDVFIESISLDPEVDTPDVLSRYAASLGTKRGWTFFTGERTDVDRLRRRLGLFDRDPAIDADKTKHSGLIVYGNEATGAWATIPGLTEPHAIVESLLRVLRSPGDTETRAAKWSR
jgi:protein SCO1/2